MKLEKLRELCEEAMPIAKIFIEIVMRPAGSTWAITFDTYVLDNRGEWQRIGLYLNVTRESLNNYKDVSPYLEMSLKRVVEAYMHSRDRISGMATSKKDYADMLVAVMGDKELHALYQVFGKLC